MIFPLLAIALFLTTTWPDGRPVSVEQFFTVRHIEAVELSPDGRSVAFLTREPEPDGGVTRVLYLHESGQTRAPAPRFGGVRSIRWSPDGEWLAFLAPPPGASGDSLAAVWAVPPFGGEPIRLSPDTGAVIDYDWGPEASMYVLIREPGAEGAALWHNEALAADSAERVWVGDPGIREIAVSPNGRAIVYSSNGSGATSDALDYDLWLLDLPSLNPRRLTSRAGPEVAPVWSPDGESVVFRALQEPRLIDSQTEIFIVATASGALRNLTEAFDRSVLEHRWPTAGDLLFRAAVGTYTHLFVWRSSGAVELLRGGPFNYGPFDTDAVGSTIYAGRESADAVPELWRLRGSDAERLSQINSAADEWTLARQAVIEWTSTDGLAIEGLLVFPADFVEGRRYPLVAIPSGGPGARFRNVVAEPNGSQLFATQGYAVLMPNARGSLGYGEGFLTMPRADLAGGELVDLLAGIDYLVELGIADSTRLAVLGDGYGGYATMRAVTRTARFRAAVASFGLAETGGYVHNAAAGVPPAVQAAAALEGQSYVSSPPRSAQRVSTPLLFIEAPAAAGTLLERARQMHRSLADMGRPTGYIDLEAGSTAGAHLGVDAFFARLRWVDRYVRLDGADAFRFYRPEEWAPGPAGWQLQVTALETRTSYTGVAPTRGRYLEVAIDFRVDPDSQGRPARPLRIDPLSAIALLEPDGEQLSAAGIVTEVFGRVTLSSDSAVVVPLQPARGADAAAIKLAFDIPTGPAQYRLRVAGFAPVRIWIGQER